MYRIKYMTLKKFLKINVPMMHESQKIIIRKFYGYNEDIKYTARELSTDKRLNARLSDVLDWKVATFRPDGKFLIIVIVE